VPHQAFAWRDGVNLKTTAFVMVVGFLVACDQPPTGPTTADFNAEREALIASQKASKRKPPAKVAQAGAGEEEADFGILVDGFTYDRTGVRDPFRNFEWEEKGRKAMLGNDRGPLEQYDLSQMSLQAVVWDTGVARALVLDPTGKSYIVGTGTRIGKNSGRVTNINDNLLVVKETYVDFLGQETTKDIEMRIRRSEGG
jgi:Tfp pilus assembly protein PilP